MSDPTQALKDLKPTKDFFIGIDSDGCVFDSMEIKHKECFCPQYINHYGLQAVSKYAREVWEFVNLYSKTRGINRFRAVTRSLDLITDRSETKSRGVQVPQLTGIRKWDEHNVSSFVQVIAGQEMGTKTEHIALAAKETTQKRRCS